MLARVRDAGTQRSYGDGNGVTKKKFNEFMNGSCSDRDYSEILDMIESSDEEDLDNQDN